jgi:hypothetical protein
MGVVTIVASEKKKDLEVSLQVLVSIGRGGEIRTHDPHVPNVVLYQAELHPDYGVYSNQVVMVLKEPRQRVQTDQCCPV